MNVSKSAVETRKRVGNDLDIIFTMTITAEISTEWKISYPQTTIKDIDLQANSFYQNLNNVNIISP